MAGSDGGGRLLMVYYLFILGLGRSLLRVNSREDV
jgi:hypothetical protein